MSPAASAIDSFLNYPETMPELPRPKTLPPIPRAVHVVADIDVVISCVCESYSISTDDLRYGGKRCALAEARTVAYWLLRSIANLSWMDIGTALNRHHTSAMAGNKTVLRLRESKVSFRAFTDELAQAVGARLGGEP